MAIPNDPNQNHQKPRKKKGSGAWGLVILALIIVSRAVTDLSQFRQWVRGKVSDIQYHHLRNGILYLKGGDLDAELAPFKKKVRTWDISDFFAEEYFQTKKVIHLPIR